MNPQDNSPEMQLLQEHLELKNKYKDLQLRVTRFSVIEQQLINARNRLDREVNIHRQLQGFNRKAFVEMPDDSFGRLVAESLIDIFEVEVGFACFAKHDDSTFEIYGLEEVGIAEAEKEALRNELSSYFLELPIGKVSLNHVDDNDWIRKRVPLRNIMLTRVFDPQLGITVGLLAGITDKGIMHYDLIDSDREALFGVFAQQVLSHHTNRLRTQTNRMQYQALQDSEEKYRMIFEGTPNGIVVADSQNYQIIYANSASCNLFGLKPGDLQNMSMKDIYAPDSWNEIMSLVQRMKQGRSIVSNEVSCVRKSGSVFYADISMHRISIGGRALVAGFFTDVTERRNARQILEANNIELKKINSELDNFVYSVSHDLRAPLLAIRGLINLIGIDGAAPEDTSSYLNMMSSSVNRMDDTIKEILEYSRNARLEVKQSPVEFRELILQCFDDVKHYFPDDIELYLEVDQSVPFYSDPNRVNTLLKNIIGNAVKYKKHDEGESFLKINVKTDAHWAVLTFEDNGEGIDEAHINKIFEMFYRASNSTVGTGLGLYIVKEIIANLGGAIQVRSEKGIGTVFTVTLKNLY